MGLPIYDRDFTEQEIEFSFEKFVARVNEKVAENYGTKFPTLNPERIGVTPGRVYWKLVRLNSEGESRSVYCFVRKADGAILKAATFRAPALNHARGFVTDGDYGLHCAGPYGVAYLR